MSLPPLLRVTDSAAKRAQTLLEKASQDVIGLRINVVTRGCSGLSYIIEYAQEQQHLEKIVEHQGVKFLIHPKAFMFLIGTEIDYVIDKLHEGFIFRNPNEKGRCGCGDSFYV